MTLQELNEHLLLCQRCPRLVDWRQRVSRIKRHAYQQEIYWGKPVPGFGDPHARVFVIGLAPGAHGSNRTGRQFTGDASGDFLFPALYRAGFANQPVSSSRHDGLMLHNLYTAPVCRCVPPGNKPNPTELDNCRSYLQEEIEILKPEIFVVLGRVAYEVLLGMFLLNKEEYPFSHNAAYKIEGQRCLVCSYHPSRQNTQTGRLTVDMFDKVWETVRRILATPL